VAAFGAGSAGGQGFFSRKLAHQRPAAIALTAAAQRDRWLPIEPKTGTDLCSIDPGFEVDLYVATDLRCMTAIWMGLDTVKNALHDRRMRLTGARRQYADMAGTKRVRQNGETDGLTFYQRKYRVNTRP
jgi:hypothetical protein